MAFIANSLSLSGVPANHVQVRQESSKDKDFQNPWIRGQMNGCNESWKWILKREMIQCNRFLGWFIELNNILMVHACLSENSSKFKNLELRKLRDIEVGGGEVSSVDPKRVYQDMHSLFSVLEKYDHENDKFIMPKRIKFSVASELAKVSWKAQFQIGYICPFFQGNWVSARLLTNTLRCHWSLPWHNFEYERDENREINREYHEEMHRWNALFDEEGVLTKSFLDY